MLSIYINYSLKYVVFITFMLFGFAHAGSYEDYFSAIKRDDVRTVQNLLARGFDPNTRDPNNFHGLFLALREPSAKVAEVLVNLPKIDLNVLTVDGESPLMMAVFRGQFALARSMIAKGADVNKTGWTPLHYASTAGDVALIKLLLDNFAYIDAESPNMTTPLMMAAHYGSAKAVKLLLEEGADANLKNANGLTAIDFALGANRQDSIDVISAFLRAQAPKGKW